MRTDPLVLRMCLGQLGSLLPHVVVPAVMAGHLIPAWGLSNAQAGLMAAAYAGGYMVAVPVLSALTDRHDARRILWLGSLFSALATFGFALLADGLVSAMVWWGLAGAGFAGAYMPGLRALTDRLVEGLRGLDGRVVSPRGEGEWSGLVSFEPNGCSSRDVVRRLAEQGVLAVARKGRVRLSPHYYNTAEEVDALLERLSDALKSA